LKVIWHLRCQQRGPRFHRGPYRKVLLKCFPSASGYTALLYPELFQAPVAYAEVMCHLVHYRKPDLFHYLLGAVAN